MELSGKAVVVAIFAVVLLIVGLSFTGRIAENVPGDKICVIQDPIDGELHFYTEQGLKYQNFGKATMYSKRLQYWFSSDPTEGSEANESIKIRFNDGGHAKISGSCSIELPFDHTALKDLYTKYDSDDAIIKDLIRPAITKAVYMTGPLMSSKESYAEKRTELLSDIEDQVTHGVYQTVSREVEGTDPMTGTKKTITVVEPIRDPKTKQILRSEESPLARFKIKVYNLSINEIKYDENVEGQIKEQQKAMMAVQTAIAEAKKAEQDAIKAEQEGKAEAAKAKWQREKEKAKAVVAAQERLEVAELDNKTAEQRKQENIKLGEGEAARRKLVMQADGALSLKLDAYKTVMTAFAENLPKQRLVPETVISSGNGTAGVTAGDAATRLMEMLNVKVARDLSLDLGTSQSRK